LALAEGLQSLTLRRVADALGVVPGLVNHYFPAVDDLAAAAFAHAAGAERASVFAMLLPAAAPVEQLRALLGLLLDESSDAISLLWLDAWQASRSRPALRAEVTRQMAAWQADLGALIARGVACNAFRCADVEVTAVRMLSLIDGLSVQAAIRFSIGYAAVRDLVVETIERELELPVGTLRR
jgi:AcrR family transcriptional regulator